jgi:hypothetical protein
MDGQQNEDPGQPAAPKFPQGFIAVDSSAFQAARLVIAEPDALVGTMEVIFHPKKDQTICASWSYSNVSRGVFDEIMGAKEAGGSIGSAFARIIKKNPTDYPGHPLPDFIPTVEAEG